MKPLLACVIVWTIFAFLLSALYFAFILKPMALYYEEKCLAAGYPEARVTVALNAYCLGGGGAVTAELINREDPNGNR